jgi:hypothetical protein
VKAVKTDQITRKPTRKLQAVGAATVPMTALATLIVWLASEAGYTVPEHVSVAIASLVVSLGGILSGYITRDRVYVPRDVEVEPLSEHPTGGLGI